MSDTPDTRRELDLLKRLVRKFLRETRYVPFRAADCNQILVYDLLDRLHSATKRKHLEKAR